MGLFGPLKPRSRYDHGMGRRWLVSFLVFALTAAGGWVIFQSVEATRTGKPAPPEPPRILVIILPAKIEARQVVTLGAPSFGILKRFFVNSGDHIVQGQLLAEVEDPTKAATAEADEAAYARARSQEADLETGLASARADATAAEAVASQARYEFDQASKVYEREKSLIGKNATPRLAYEKAVREYGALKEALVKAEDVLRIDRERVKSLGQQLESARAAAQSAALAADTAKAALAGGEIRSSIDGFVIARHESEGAEITTVGQPLFEIAPESGDVQAVLAPEPSKLACIHTGDDVLVSIAGQVRIYPGVVREVKTGRVVVDFTGSAPHYEPGLRAEAKLRLSRAYQCPTGT